MKKLQQLTNEINDLTLIMAYIRLRRIEGILFFEGKTIGFVGDG
jgi:hypothetical protein